MFELSSGRLGASRVNPGQSGSTALEGLGLRALIVEDELLVAMELESTLEDLGIEVCSIASNGHDAIAAFEAETPTLVFMDVNLRGSMDGVEVASAIRQKSTVPIVFITAYSDPANRLRIRTAAPEAPIVAKPAGRGDIEAAIHASVRKSEQH